MADKKNKLSINKQPIEGYLNYPNELIPGNLLEILNTEKADSDFAELLNNLEKSECTDSERINFLNNMGNFDKLGLESFNKLLSICNKYNKKINKDLLKKFSDLPYKVLVRSANYINFKQYMSRKESYVTSSHADDLESFLDTINCKYDDESFRSLCDSFVDPSRLRILGVRKRHDLSVKKVIDWYNKHLGDTTPIIFETFFHHFNDDELNVFLQMFSQSEIDEYSLIRLCGDCSAYFPYKNHDFTFAGILDKYHLDYHKFCRYYFINTGRDLKDKNRDKKRNKYDFDIINKFRELFKTNNIPSFIPDDLESILKKDEDLTKMKPKDIIEYCKNYEIKGGEDLQYPTRKKFTIIFSPVDKKLSCVYNHPESLHRAALRSGAIILGGGYFKTINEDTYVLEGYSEEFGGFDGYENWISKMLSGKTKLHYCNNYSRYPDEEYQLKSWYHKRMGYGKYRTGH